MTSKKNEYIVSLQQFEGPLDLLHQLIEKRKLQINTISLTKITTDYLAHIRAMTAVPAEEVARFMHIAATLILIKSKSLLPILEYTKEEKSDVAELENRMNLFDYIRAHAVPALNRWKKRMYTVQAPEQEQQIIFSPDVSCTVKTVQYNAQAALQKIPFLKEPPRKKVGKTIRIEQIIEKVLAAVTERISVSFGDMAGKADKQEKIVSFLAVLELMRKNILSATQDRHFDDITITRS